ncbi:exo-alpha-sialidase [Blastococcus sp. BMG 814]|uniref:Exo-alpha-sialidase n=1 Tax=Blastococcus carthaginiensis TaxID=3050034 RepID=A0ABT9IA50_9ACTN|nr:exo-alpha-sialidase [Blastococcus carthaginiensis]MDP5182112.1 exo-alpha-sialidase [Blastococcus carthaginiensis]
MRAPRSACRVTVTTAALGLVLVGCSAGGPAPAATPTAAPTAAQAGELPAAHVHAVAIDPGDGALLLATHDGLIAVGDDGALTASGPVIDLMGFSVAGHDHYLASGHPGPGTDLPDPVGLIESTDGGRTWTPLSRAGESDFHALTLLPDGGALGYDGALRRTTDGTTWEQLDIPAEPHTLAAAPDSGTALATTAQGLLRSTDSGSTWARVAGAPVLQVVAWADASTAAGVDPAGVVWTSTDDARTWQRAADLGEAPHAIGAAVAAAGLRVAVVTGEGLVESVDGGATFTTLLTS